MSLFRYVNINKPDRISLRKVFELMKINLFLLHIIRGHKFLRGVAQLASALAWGARGRVFESHHPDTKQSESEHEV